MKDRIGKRPIIKSRKIALDIIYKIASDKRSHVMLKEAFDWELLKMKEIKRIANKFRRS